MKTFKLTIIVALLCGCLSSCIIHRGVNYGSRRYQREHMPVPPPGYRGL